MSLLQAAFESMFEINLVSWQHLQCKLHLAFHEAESSVMVMHIMMPVDSKTFTAVVAITVFIAVTGTTPDPTLGQGGGAIYAVSFNVLSIKGSNFTGNTASRVNITDFKLGRGAGGAISINSDAVSLSSCGAGRVTISACHFTDNHANSGGAIQAVGSGHLAQTFNSRSNSRTSYGRYNVSYLASLPFNSYTFAAQTMAYCTVSDSVFEGNSALLGGGALSVLQGYSVQLTNLSFTDNTTPLYGGAIAVANGSGLFTESCTFKACTAAQGGAIYAVAPSEAYIQFNVIPLWRNFNIYPSDVYKLGRQMGSAVSLSNNVFVDSSATTAGAAVYMSGDSQLVSQENTFTGGQAGTQGVFHLASAAGDVPNICIACFLPAVCLQQIYSGVPFFKCICNYSACFANLLSVTILLPAFIGNLQQVQHVFAHLPILACLLTGRSTAFCNVITRHGTQAVLLPTTCLHVLCEIGVLVYHSIGPGALQSCHNSLHNPRLLTGSQVAVRTELD